MKNQFVGKVGAAEVLTYIFLTLVLIFAVLPLFFMATAAFMDAKQIMSMPYTWIPSSKYFTTSTRTFLTNFQKAIVGNHGDNIFFTNLLNSLVVAASCAFTTVILRLRPCQVPLQGTEGSVLINHEHHDDSI